VLILTPEEQFTKQSPTYVKILSILLKLINYQEMELIEKSPEMNSVSSQTDYEDFG
jgi:hypothetical protein